MKKLILLLLISISSYSQTFEDISDLIDLNLSSGSKITALKHREVEHALLNYIQENIAQTGDIKRIKCDITYLNDNFEVNGLGKNLRLGWAICNGNNGTDNLAGRVGIGYGTGYSTLGATGGSKDAVVVSHSHNVVINGQGGGDGYVTYNDGIGSAHTYTTNTVGVDGTNKNMQPYIVQLYIMKL